MNKSEQIGNLAAALVAAQAELKNPSLDSTNPHFKSKFASLANVRNVVTTTFAKHGLAIVQNLSSTDRGINCTTLIVHSSGEWMESDLVSIPATKMDAQGFGSAATYARRYSLSAFASVVGDDDDDGNEAAKPTKKELSAVRPNSSGEDFWANAQGEEYLTDVLGLGMNLRGQTVNRRGKLTPISGRSASKNDPPVPEVLMARSAACSAADRDGDVGSGDGGEDPARAFRAG